ncbi:hypothetical protein PFISCL1PPCAC_4965, partial [Pristionchus fissidentatus]
QAMTPMSSSFLPMGLGGRLSTAFAVEPTKPSEPADTMYDYATEDSVVEESNQLQKVDGVLIYDEASEGKAQRVRDPRHIRQPLRTFEKVNKRRDKFVFVRPDKFYDKNGTKASDTVDIKHGIEEISEAISLGSGRP